MSTILKRFEIWCLLAIVVAGSWWAFQAETVETKVVAVSAEARVASMTEDGPDATESTLLEVREVNLTETDQGTVVELTLFGRSGVEEAVTLGEENLELLTSEGEGVHRFFLPFDADPMLASEEKSLVTLKYWLEHPADVLWLTYRDQTVKVEIPTASI